MKPLILGSSLKDTITIATITSDSKLLNDSLSKC